MKIALVIVVAIVIGFFAIGLAGTNSPEGQDRARRRDAIRLCWSDYERKSLDPATKRFVASTCEGMERKYESQFGRKP